MEPSAQTCLRESSSQQFLLKVVPFKMVFTQATVKAPEGRVSTEERPEQNRISEQNKTNKSRFFFFFVHTPSKFTPVNREKPNKQD